MNLGKWGFCALALFGLVAMAAAPALATSVISATGLTYNDNVTPDVIFGSGNGNGYFTVDRENGVEIGLRGKVAYQGIYNSNGDGTYSYDTGNSTKWGGIVALWNFEWSINTNYDGSSGLNVADLNIQMGLDYDPSTGTNYETFDPIFGMPVNPDHAFGTNTTPNGGGTVAADAGSLTTDFTTPGDYGYLTVNDNVVQNSWNLGWFANSPYTFDPTIPGTYDIFLNAYDEGGNKVAGSSIQVLVGGGGPANQAAAVPEPMTMFGLLAGLTGVAGYIRKRRIA